MFGICWQTIDFWAERYQTLAVGLLAVAIAVFQLRISQKQTKIAEDQQRIIMTQDATSKALDKMTIRDFVRYSMAVHTRPAMVSRELSRDADGKVTSLTWTDLSFPEGIATPDANVIRAAAVNAFPEAASEIMELRNSMADLQSLVSEYKAEPWRNTDVKPDVGPAPDDFSERDRAMSTKTNQLVTRFHHAVYSCVMDLKLQTAA